MGISEKLLDPSYKPNAVGNIPISFDHTRIIKCPVSFTTDPIEYIEKYIQYRLKPVQKLIVEDLFKTDSNGNSIYNQSVYIGGMRCLGRGTEILMYDGTLKKIEDIITGDLVMGPDSKPRSVLEVSKGEDALYKIEQSCAIDYIVNSEHILSLKKAKSVKKAITNSYGNKYNRYNSFSDIVNISIKDYLKQSKKWKYFFRGYTSGLIEFKEQEIPIDPYFIGLWLGDGCSRQPMITSADKEIIDWLNLYCNRLGAVLSISDKRDNRSANYHLKFKLGDGTGKFGNSNPILDKLRKLNLILNKHIPQCYISNSKEIRLKVLAGLIDTDGFYKTHGYEITLANEVLAKDVKRLADSLGYRTNIRKKKTTCKYNNFEGVAWRLSIYGNVWEIPCLIERKKYKHTGKHSHKEIGLSSLKVTSIGIGKYAGIAVDKDNLFCLSDGTVTHNSGKSVCSGIVGSFLLHKLLAMDEPGIQLGQAPGQKFVAEYIATSEQQSKQTAYAAFEQIILKSPWWKKYIGYLRERELKEGKDSLFQQFERKIVFHEKNLEAHSLHSNSASLAGFTAFFVCFDEMSRFDVSESNVQQKSEKRSAQAVYYTASRAAKTLSGFSKIMTVTSPMYESDFGMQLLYMANEVKAGPSTKSVVDALRSKYTNRVSDIIGYHYCTYEANPKTEEDPFGYTEHSFDAEKIANYSTFLRDYMAIPPAAISPFFELPERIEKCVNYSMQKMVLFTDEILSESVGQEIRKYIGKKIQILNGNKLHKYFVCCDQGAVKDSFVVAMGHAEGVETEVPNARGGHIKTKRNKVIIDFVEAWKPSKEERITVSFRNVEEVIKILNSFYYIALVAYDQWSSVESIERLFSEGIVTKKLGADIEMYETLKVLVYSGMIDFPDSPLLLDELRQLNSIKNRKIEHPTDGCFSGDTKIPLVDGTVKTLRELSDLGKENEFWVYSCLSDGTIVPAKAYNAHKTKTVEEIIEVTLDNGESFECTSDHLWMLRNGMYKKASNLKENDSLMPFYRSIYNFKYKKGGIGKYSKIKNNKTGRWNWEHRLFIKNFGVQLNKEDIVHHKNFNSLDNRPFNLEKLSREEHAQRHIIANKKIHSKESIKKRNETFKKTYKNSEELQKKFRDNGTKIFNDPIIRKKSIEGSKKRYKEFGLPEGLKLYFKSDKAKEDALAKMNKYFTKEILSENGKKLNTIFWKSEKGICRRKELSSTQLVNARKKRTKESFKKIGEGVSRFSKEKAFSKLDHRFEYVLSYHHISMIFGGGPEVWKKRLPNFDFSINAKKLDGKSLEDIKLLTGIKLRRSLVRMLRPLNMEYLVREKKINHKVKSIKLIKKTIDVYDISVPTYENFALDNGTFVHNSKDLADAVCRVAWCVYLDSIRDAVHGKFMLPMGQQIATVRSVATAYESLKNDEYGTSSIFGSSGGAGSGKGVFGKSMIIQPNVVPNIGNNSLK